MGGNYEKGVYNQLMEVMEKLNAMESEHSRDRKEVRELTSEVTGLRKENAHLKDEVSDLKQKTTFLAKENAHLKTENRLLQDDNERMKRSMDNDSSNSSTPPSKDQPGNAPNTFNGRKPTKKKPGAQQGHKGSGLSKMEVERKIRVVHSGNLRDSDDHEGAGDRTDCGDGDDTDGGDGDGADGKAVRELNRRSYRLRSWYWIVRTITVLDSSRIRKMAI